MAGKERPKNNFFSICAAITVLGAPIMLSLALNILNSYMSIWWIGQYLKTETSDSEVCHTNSSCISSSTKVYISAVGLSNLSYNVCGISIIYGLSSGLQVLMSQAHGAGSSEKGSKSALRVIALQRIHLQRTAIILLVASVPLTLMNVFLTPVRLEKRPCLLCMLKNISQ